MFDSGSAVAEVDDDLPVITTPWDHELSPVGPTTVHDVSAALDEVATIQERIHALEGEKLLAVERARRTAVRCEPELLAGEELAVLRAGTSRRHELARRAFTADLATTLRVPEHRAAHLLDTAQTLTRSGTATLLELRRGRTSVDHATAMADTLADLPDLQARAAVQAAALPRATSATLPQFRACLRRARDRAHPEPFTSRHRKASQKRAVYLDPGADGMAWLSAYLPATSAHAAFDRLTTVARAARDAGDQRSLPQLRADTLDALLLAAADHTPADTTSDHVVDRTGARAGDRADIGLDTELAAGVVPDLADHARRITPRVQVTVPVLALLGRTDDPAELAGHGPVDPQTAATLAGAAPSLRRLLVDPDSGRMLSTDPGTYTVPAALRAYLQARDGTCRFPGCTRPAAGCDLDHTIAWADGGTTTAGNLAHLCRRHHVVKHGTRWATRQDADGTLIWTSPTGRVFCDPVADPVDLTGRVLRAPAESSDDEPPDDEASPHATSRAGPDPLPTSAPRTVQDWGPPPF